MLDLLADPSTWVALATLTAMEIVLGVDNVVFISVLVSRLPVWGRKACLVIGHALMLYVTWLLFEGSLAQARINLDVQAPVTGASVAIFYASGVVFAVSAAVMLVSNLLRLLSGQLQDTELVMVQESEDLAPAPTADDARGRGRQGARS